MMVDMTLEHPVNEILAIRRYHVIYTFPYRHLSKAVHPIVEASSLHERLRSMSSSKIS